tara:strand:+ start:3453 stop:4166 length:714 start_codon:yes stop_codon:yes gene_type:complete
MLPVDNLYVLDVPGNEHTLKILSYFNDNIQKYNGLAKRKIRVYRLTKPMIKKDDIMKKFEDKGITILPSLEIFQPRPVIFSNAEEIIAFCDTLFKDLLMRIQKRQKTKQREQTAGPMMLNGGDNPYADFMKTEALSKDNEENVNADMSTHMNDRYRNALQRRAPAGMKKGADDEEMDEMDDPGFGGGGDPEEPPPTRQDPDVEAEDNVMSSVNKICGKDPDGEIERAFYENLQVTDI